MWFALSLLFNMRYRIVLNPRYEIIRDYVESLVHLRPEEIGAVVYEARNMIYSNCVNGVKLTVKCFKVPSLLNRVIYSYFRKGKAKRSYENGMRLQDLEIGTATPMAYVEEYSFGLLARSYYVCAFLENMNDIRNWHLRENNHEILAHTAAFMAKLHKKGVWHKDFSPGNILYDKDWNFYLIDINRMKFNVHEHRKLMQNFKCLHDEPEETARIATLYAGCVDGADPEMIVGDALVARKKYKDHQARKRAIKSWFKRKKQ